MVTASVLITILFLGGWHVWGMSPPDAAIGWSEAILRVLVLLGKSLLVVLFFMLVRWTWPRFRFDQLMALGWKVMLPLGLLNLAAIAVLEEMWHGEERLPTLGYAAAAWAVMIVGWIAVAWAAPRLADNRPYQALPGSAP
jgi:NADH-quinone oxidoreductase subunit H